MCINAATPSITNYHLINNISSLLLTKFEKINISLSKNLNKEEIDKIFNFFEKELYCWKGRIENGRNKRIQY